MSSEMKGIHWGCKGGDRLIILAASLHNDGWYRYSSVDLGIGFLVLKAYTEDKELFMRVFNRAVNEAKTNLYIEMNK